MGEALLRVGRCDPKLLRVLYYPRGYGACDRVEELYALGVRGLHLVGGVELPGGIRVLGKGTSGIVVKGVLSNGRVVAVKIRRLDSSRRDMYREATLTLMANEVGVGPRVYLYSKNFIVMELVEGLGIRDFVGVADRSSLSRFITSLLDQCRRLDMIHLDHGELSRAEGHVYSVNGKPVIVDFESASTARRPRNLTGILSYLVFGANEVARKVRATFGLDLGELRRLLRMYKAGRWESYGEIVELFGE